MVSVKVNVVKTVAVNVEVNVEPSPETISVVNNLIEWANGAADSQLDKERPVAQTD